MGSIYIRSGYTSPHPLQTLGLIWLNALLLLSISILGGTSFSTLANGVMVFGLYGIAFIGGWIEQIGSFLPNPSSSQTAMNIGIITSLLIPTEAIWKRAAHELQSPLLGAIGFSPFSSSSYPSNLMLCYAVIYLLAAIAIAVRLFHRRDL